MVKRKSTIHQKKFKYRNMKKRSKKRYQSRKRHHLGKINRYKQTRKSRKSRKRKNLHGGSNNKINTTNINVRVLAPYGTDYELGQLPLTTTVLQIKQQLAQMSPMGVGSQTLFHMEDGRGEDADLRLGNGEMLGEVRRYGSGWKEEEKDAESEADAVLRLCVMLQEVDDVVEWLEGIGTGTEPAVRIGDGSRGYADHQLNNPMGIVSVPAHPHLVVVTSLSSHQVRVYDIESSGGGGGRLLCTMGKDDGSDLRGEGEFYRPWGVVVTADSAHVIIADHSNNRLQLLTLTVSDEGTKAALAFVRFIGEGQMKWPRGLALRSVGGRETVLVAEETGNQVSEWAMDGTKVRTVCGTGKKGSGDGELNDPADVTVLPVSGHIAITDRYNHRVVIVDGGTGSFLHAFGSKGKEKDGQFDRPLAVAADAHDHLLVLDNGSDRLQVFDVDGTHLCTRNDLGIKGSGSKGLEWWTEVGGGRLAIANGIGHDVRFFTLK